MRTLDEVIAYFDNQTQQRHVYLTEDAEDIYNDALHYLKEHREKQKTLKIREAEYKRGFEQLGIEWSRIKENPPLTWDELRQMEGKPVWVESHGNITEFTGWAIVRNALEDRVHFIFSHYDGEFLTYEMALPDVTFGKEWKAYRKERS